jgi:hypothetical protein
MDMVNDLEDTTATPGALLRELRTFRAITRSRRHAYWFPLLVFGLLVCAAAPQYVSPAITTNDGIFTTGDTWLIALSGWSAAPSGSNVRGLYWLFAMLAGSVITALWYGWHAQLTGVSTRVRGSVLTWVLGAVALATLSLVSVSLVLLLWPLTLRGTAGLMVIAFGLVALAWVERSRGLAVITAIYLAAACLGVFYDPQNLLYKALSLLGVSDAAMPYSAAGTVNVLLPGLVLLGGALLALRADLRQR